MKRVYAKTKARGYGWKHEQERARVERVVKAGRAVCVRCSRLIARDATWDLDHGDVKVEGRWLGPAHSSCNRSAGAKKRQQGGRLRWSRSW